jgi:predicted nucleotide-binding protein (sugar kinase/HSP70/actin superfamily)
MKNSIYFLFIVALNATLLSCNRDEVQAENSVRGVWQITSTNVTKGEFDESNFVSNESEMQTGQLGSFDFGEDVVTYNLNIGEEIMSGTKEPWTLTTKKVNSGFTRINVNTLTIGNKFVFDVTFEDGTKNSERKATRMALVSDPTLEQPIFIETTLIKK